MWPEGAPSSRPLCPCETSSSFFEQFLLSGHRTFQAHLVLSLPPSWKGPFLQESLIPFCGEWYLEKNQALGIVAPRSCDWTKLGNTYIYIILSLFYTHPSTYFYVCLYTCKTRSSHRYIQLQSGTTGFILVFSLSVSITSLSNRNPAPIILNILTHLIKAPSFPWLLRPSPHRHLTFWLGRHRSFPPNPTAHVPTLIRLT